MKKRDDPKTVELTESIEPVTEEVIDETASEIGPEIEPEAVSNIEPDVGTDTGPEGATSIEDSLVVDELRLDDADFAEPPHEYHAPDDAAYEPAHRTLATTALMILVGVIVIASLTLWAAPKLAPHLPAGVAQYLLPGQIDTENRLASLDNALAAGTAKSDAAIAALNAEIAALSGRIDASADSGQTDAAVAAAQTATDVTASLATRLDMIEAELAALRDEFSAVSSALADAGTGNSPASPEIAAAVAALGARLDNLATSVSAGTAALDTRLDAVEVSAAAARDVQSEALGEASTAVRQARLQAANDLLDSRLTGGLPYDEKLNELAELTGAAPPTALSAAADTGLATAVALEASFGRHAQAAVAADVQASAGDGTGLQALGWLRAQVAGRPTAEQPGDSVGAITSRIAARVEEGNLAAALTEAETLPAHAQTGLGDWLDQLRARVAADAALADWRAKIGAGG
ncbi:MAG TPA: hypothetical protein VMY41_12870 [Thermohalobaculum sp.]|nr:hypothetical protein [Thermohalobaculum sp.]